MPPEAIHAMNAMRKKGKELAEWVIVVVPDCADKTVALRTIREAVYWATIAIAHEWPKNENE